MRHKTNLLGLIIALLCAHSSFASVSQQRPGPREVTFKIVSAEVTRFEKPVRIGVGKRAIEYLEALVLKVQVSRDEFDSLPPDIAPFLYIGRRDYRIFHIDRQDQSRELVLTFHVRNWQQLEEGGLMILTTEHGGPVREPEKFRRREGLRYSKSLITRRS
jgi:hypothetical protein